MKIVIVHPHDVYSHPWMIRPIKIAEELIRRGHSISLCFIPEHKRRCGFGIIHKNLPPQLKLFPLKWARRGVLANAKIIEEAAKDADIIHIQKADSSTALPGLIAAWRLNKPVHYDWDDWETEILKEMHYTGPKVFDLYWYEKQMPKFVDTLSVSSRALSELAVRYGMPEKRIVPAPVGADLELFNPKISGDSIREKHNVKGPLVIYAGQLDGANYLELLIRAIPLVNQSIPETSFFIVGDGESLKEHKKLASGLNIQNITYTGYIPHDEVPAYLAAADVAVACFAETPVSRCKSPLKIVEYLASGKAIVASKVGEAISMVEDCGRMVKPGDSKELAEQIVYLLQNPGLRMELERKSRQKAEQQYNWKVTVNQIEQAYQMAVSHRRSGQLKRLYYLLLLGVITFVFFSYGFYLKIMGKTEPERVWEPGRE